MVVFASLYEIFTDEKLDGYQKKKYVCKLLFIFLLGIDIDFGYQEAVNLLSSLKFSEKQIVSLNSVYIMKNIYVLLCMYIHINVCIRCCKNL